MKDALRRLQVPCTFATLAVAAVCFGPVARGEPSPPVEPLTYPEAQLEPLQWATLQGWAEDDHAAAFAVFQASCKPLVTRLKARRHKNLPPRDTRPMRAALTEVCTRAVTLGPADGEEAREFFEENFRPVQVGKLGEETGLLTGYYEPIIEGSRFPSYDYVVPVYAPPSNLIAPGRRRAGETGFPNKGRVGRREGDKIVPYHDRSEIEEGVLAGQGLEICWVKDPIDAFFMQIQGSARVKLDTGKTLRLNYAAHNGHPYTPVGRILIERNLVPKAEMSMDRIRQWMETNPDEGKGLRRANRSFVFMRETGLADDAEPTGAQGISLTPGRSIAVDRALHVYGTPFFITANLPIDSERPNTPFRRLMVAQDTGSAIVGVARADIYWGAGDEAGRIAGRIKQQGQFVMLVPKPLDPAVTSDTPPLPFARPPQPDDPPMLVAFDSRPEKPATAASAKAAFDAAMVAKPAAAAPAKTPALAYAVEPGPQAFPVPLPRLRPEPLQVPALALTRVPDWLHWMASMTAKADPAPVFGPADGTQARSYASAEAAIAALTSAPAVLTDPNILFAAMPTSQGATAPRAVPVPKPRPQGTPPDPQ